MKSYIPVGDSCVSACRLRTWGRRAAVTSGCSLSGCRRSPERLTAGEADGGCATAEAVGMNDRSNAVRHRAMKTARLYPTCSAGKQTLLQSAMPDEVSGSVFNETVGRAKFYRYTLEVCDNGKVRRLRINENGLAGGRGRCLEASTVGT